MFETTVLLPISPSYQVYVRSFPEPYANTRTSSFLATCGSGLVPALTNAGGSQVTVMVTSSLRPVLSVPLAGHCPEGSFSSQEASSQKVAVSGTSNRSSCDGSLFVS